MIVTNNLMQEHQLILKYVDLMERYAAFSLTQPNPPILLEKAACFIDFIREYADHFHHAKEEDILFRYLEIPGVLTHCNPIPQMLLEHQKAREFLRNMELAHQESALIELASNAVQYAGLLKEHIYKENNILYPMGEGGLSNALKMSIQNEYNNLEQKINGQAIRERFEHIYTELEQYLNSLSKR